jgi:hypothetical protein
MLNLAHEETGQIWVPLTYPVFLLSVLTDQKLP